jgi:FMN phosphatase YigB (HAD superfamily)
MTGADPSRSLMIGDDWDADILGARNAGMDQAFLTSTEDLLHELGSVTTDRPMRHNFHPTYTLRHLNELMVVL